MLYIYNIYNTMLVKGVKPFHYYYFFFLSLINFFFTIVTEQFFVNYLRQSSIVLIQIFIYTLKI